MSGDDKPGYRFQGGDIFLDKEGRWYHEGVEITHKLTADLFSRSIQRDPEGGYRLVVGLEWAPIQVEDTAFVVRRVDVEDKGALLRLNDGTEEALDPATLRVGDDNVLYCEVKSGTEPARFLRPAYYQLMQNLEEASDGYAVRLGGRLWPIKMD